MRTSWIIGVMMLYITILVFGSIITTTSSFGVGAMGGDTDVRDNFGSLATPEGVDKSESTIADWSIVKNVWNYFKIFIGAVFLWFPALWTGNWIYVWMFLCLPICIGMVLGIVTILRGSSSS